MLHGAIQKVKVVHFLWTMVYKFTILQHVSEKKSKLFIITLSNFY